MRKLLFSLSILVVCFSFANATNNYFGLQTNMDPVTFTLGWNNPPYTCGAVPALGNLTYECRDTFVYYLKADLTNAYPNGGVMTSWTHYDDATASRIRSAAPCRSIFSSLTFSS